MTGVSAQFCLNYLKVLIQPQMLHYLGLILFKLLNGFTMTVNNFVHDVTLTDEFL